MSRDIQKQRNETPKRPGNEVCCLPNTVDPRGWRSDLVRRAPSLLPGAPWMTCTC